MSSGFQGRRESVRTTGSGGVIRRRSLRTGDGPLDTEAAAERYERDRRDRRRANHRRDRKRSGGGEELEVSTVEGHVESSVQGLCFRSHASGAMLPGPCFRSFGLWSPSEAPAVSKGYRSIGGRQRGRTVLSPPSPEVHRHQRSRVERSSRPADILGHPRAPGCARPHARVARAAARAPRWTRGVARSRARRTRSSAPGTRPLLPGTAARAARARVDSRG